MNLIFICRFVQQIISWKYYNLHTRKEPRDIYTREVNSKYITFAIIKWNTIRELPDAMQFD